MSRKTQRYALSIAVGLAVGIAGAVLSGGLLFWIPMGLGLGIIAGMSASVRLDAADLDRRASAAPAAKPTRRSVTP